MEPVPDLLDLIEIDELTQRAKAKGGDPDARFCLGLKYYQGSGCTRDFSKAACWYRKAAEQGHAEAQEKLAEMIDLGQGLSRNPEEAAEWYRKAAEQDRVKAQARLAIMLDQGEGIPRDVETAAIWYCRAAERGDETAQLRWAEMLDKGEGVPGNRKEAAKWYHRLALRGNPAAKTWIDAFDAEEVKKLREAAMRGNAKARFGLAEAYEEGHGVQKDIVLAWMWGQLAADGGCEKANELLEGLEQEMTAAEIAKARRSVGEWKRAHS